MHSSTDFDSWSSSRYK